MGLAGAIQRELGVSKKAALGLVSELLGHITAALLDGQKVKISGFGTFFVKAREGHVKRGPRASTALVVPPRRVLLFRPSPYFSGRVAGSIGPERRPYDRGPRPGGS